jgi:hypothetical protein
MNIIIIIFIIMICFYCFPSQKEHFFGLQNIYDQPLESCGNKEMSNGSWDSEGKCSELDDGVHQICIENISNNAENFSSTTGQSTWSDERGSDNHCVCLGAWSLYNAQLKRNDNFKLNEYSNNKILKCEAIPKNALSLNYVEEFSEGWNRWNGLELNNQIKEGVESLFYNCYDSNDPKSEKLKKNYCDLAEQVEELQDSNLFKNYCK